MAESTIKLIVDAAGAVSPLKRVTKETEKLDGAVRKANGRLENTKKKFADAGKGAQSFTKSLGGLKGAILGLGLAALTKRMVGQAASFAETKVRLKALSAEYGEYGRIQQLVEQNAKTFNQSQAESASNFADVFARLRPLGTSLEDIQTVYKGFNATALASGTSAAAASGAFLQLSQALGSGRLQGDEFRSIAEQVPGILRLVSDEMGVTVGELKKLGSDGKITSDILINALAKGFDLNKDKIQQLLDESPAQKFKEFGNATSELSNAVGTELLPVVVPMVEEFTKLIEAVGDLPEPIKQTGVALLALTAAVTVLAPLVGTLATGIGAVGTALVALKALLTTQAALMATFGVKIYATAAAAGVLTKAMVLLNAAMAAAPWVALIAGLAYVAKGAVDAKTKIDNLEASLRDTSGTGEELKQKMQETADKIETLKGQLDKAGPSAAFLQKKIDLLTDSLNKMKGRYDIEIVLSTFGVDVASLEDGFFGPAGAAIKPKKKKKTTLAPSGAGKGKSAAQVKDITTAMEALLLKEQELRFSGDELAQSRIQKEIEIQRLIESQLKPRELGIKLLKAENDELFRTATIFKQLFEDSAAIDDKIKAGNLEGVRAGFAAGKETDDKLQEQAKKLDDLYKGIGNTIQTGIVDAIDTGIEGLINGTKDLGESLQEIASGVLKDIGRQLLSFGVKLGLQALAGGGSSFFAEGGYVTGPTNAVIGEGGEPEYIIPESKMRESMGRYSRGSRGNSVIPTSGGGGDASGGGTATLAPIDVRYSVERINSVDYVTADQFQAGMREAASSGARQGEQRALSTLRQNTTQRRRIGI